MIISKKSIYSKFCSFFRLNTAPLSILFFGSDIISKELLAPLHQNLTLPSTSPLKLLTNLEVVTHHKTALRGFYPIHSFCDQYGIPYNSPLTSKSKGDHSLEWDNFLTNKVSKAQGFDLGIVCSFGYMIPDKLIEYCKEGIIIVHPSLLPKYRGAAPIYHALLNGDKVSGVSFIDISSNKFDAGQILTQISLEISEKWKYNVLF